MIILELTFSFFMGSGGEGREGEMAKLKPAIKYQQSALFPYPDYAFNCISKHIYFFSKPALGSAISLLFRYNVASILSPSFNYVSATAPSPSWRSPGFIISA